MSLQEEDIWAQRDDQELTCTDECPWEDTAPRTEAFRRNQLCRHLGLRLASLQNCEKTNVYCLSHPVSGIFYGSPNKLIQNLIILSRVVGESRYRRISERHPEVRVDMQLR